MNTVYDYLVAMYLLSGESLESARAKAEADCTEIAEADAVE